MSNRITNGCTQAQLAIKPGDAVTYRHDDDSVTTHKARGIPEMLGGHTLIVRLEGVAGCVALCRVQPVKSEAR